MVAPGLRGRRGPAPSRREQNLIAGRLRLGFRGCYREQVLHVRAHRSVDALKVGIGGLDHVVLVRGMLRAAVAESEVPR